MRSFLRVGFVAIALFFVFGVVSVSETNAQVNQILKQMQWRYKRLKTLRADVIYEIYNFQLKDSDSMRGSLIYLPLTGRNADLRLDWKTPRSELLSVVDKQYLVYTPSLKQAYFGSTENVKKADFLKGTPVAFLNMSRAQIKADNSIKYLGIEKLSNGTKVWHLELTPKNAQRYKKADLWIDGHGMPLQLKITQKNLDTNTILLSKAKKNGKIKSEEFKIALPKNTKIIKN